MILVGFLIRVILGIFFLRAGALKLVDTSGFAQAVRNYDVLPGRLVKPMATGVVATELVGGALLVLGIELRPVGFVLAALLLVFSCAIAINLLRGRTMSCGCSGSSASDISWRHVLGNCCTAAAVIVVAIWAAEPLSLLAGVRDVHESAAWSARAVCSLIILTSALAACLLAVETRRVWHDLMTTASRPKGVDL